MASNKYHNSVDVIKCFEPTLASDPFQIWNVNDIPTESLMIAYKII